MAISKITPTIGLKPRRWMTSENILRDIYDDVTSGELPGIRKVDELVVP